MIQFNINFYYYNKQTIKNIKIIKIFSQTDYLIIIYQ